MLGKPRILSLFPNSFNKFTKHEHSCKILYLFYGMYMYLPACVVVKAHVVLGKITLTYHTEEGFEQVERGVGSAYYTS